MLDKLQSAQDWRRNPRCCTCRHGSQKQTMAVASSHGQRLLAMVWAAAGRMHSLAWHVRRFCRSRHRCTQVKVVPPTGQAPATVKKLQGKVVRWHTDMLLSRPT